MVTFTGKSDIPRITFFRDEVTNIDILDLYALAAKKSGIDGSKGSFDCTKILVSEGVMNALYENYSKQGYSDPDTSALMLFCGPKVSKDLPGLSAQLKDGFHIPETA